MGITIIFLSMVGCSLCQQWHGAGSYQPSSQVSVDTGSQQMRALWSPSSSSVHQDSWSNGLQNSQDRHDTLERHLSYTGPMVFPPGHEGMFYIPPAPHHLPRSVHSVHSLNQNTPTVSSNSPQVIERADEGHPRTTNFHSWSSPSHESWPGWPQSSRWSINSVPSIEDLAPRNHLTTQI